MRGGVTHRTGLLVTTLALGCCLRADPGLPAAIRNAFHLAHWIQQAGVDGTGNVYLAGTARSGFLKARTVTTLGNRAPSSLFLAKVSASGQEVLHVTEIGLPEADSFLQVGGMLVERDGNVVLASTARAPGIPTTEGSFRPKAEGGGAFLLKLSPSGDLVFSTYLDDGPVTYTNKLTVDPNGNYLVAGVTYSKTFPTTPDAHQRLMVPGTTTSGFVSRISKDGKQLLNSTLIALPVSGMVVDSGGMVRIAAASDETDGSYAILNAGLSRVMLSKPLPDGCLPYYGYGLSLTIDKDENTYLACSTNPGYRPARITKFDKTANVVWDKSVPNVRINAAIPVSGGLWVAGAAYRADVPTKGTLQPCNMNQPREQVPPLWQVHSGWFMVLDGGGEIVHSSFLGGSPPAGYGDGNSVLAIASVDGIPYLVGTTNSRDFPGGTELRLENDRSALVNAFGLQLDLASIERGGPAPSCLAVSMLSGQGVEAPVVPASLMTMFGSGFGPSVGVSGDLGAEHNFPTELAGVRVTVADIPAPLLYVHDSQIRFLVPKATSGPTAEVCVHRDGARACLFAFVGSYAPVIMSSVVNEDGTLNSPDNPAASGSIVSLFGFGFGAFDPDTPDGTLTGAAVTRSEIPLSTSFHLPGGRFSRDESVTPSYVGTAPGMVNGANQVNIRVPFYRGRATLSIIYSGRLRYVAQRWPTQGVAISIK
jgi:uncharacterized protein (TIGR03437 family)